MPFQLQPFSDVALDEPRLRDLLRRHDESTIPALDRLWRYYRNPRVASVNNTSHVAQAAGLPARLTHPASGDPADRREIVIENDIAWRLHAMVDFLLGAPVSVISTASDESLRTRIEEALDAIFEASGGVALLQDMALLAAIYGHVGLLLRTGDLHRAIESGVASARASIDELAPFLRIELVPAPRVIPLPDPTDYRRMLGVIITHRRRDESAERDEQIVEIITPAQRQLYIDEQLVESERLRHTSLPYIHIQNISQPLRFAGLSEVEALIPLQDELNTRLSDRANRVTMQSFRMYLARGVDTMREAPSLRIAPGQLWTTDNPDAGVDAFGGDVAAPGEDNHIEQVRQAMDKTSSVTPIAAGVLGGKVGQLSSENALRIAMMGLISKTARKRLTFGSALAQLAALILETLDFTGALPTQRRDRDVRVEWPETLPQRELERVQAAEIKERLGVPAEQLRAELGYSPLDPGVE